MEAPAEVGECRKRVPDVDQNKVLQGWVPFHAQLCFSIVVTRYQPLSTALFDGMGAEWRAMNKEKGQAIFMKAHPRLFAVKHFFDTIKITKIGLIDLQ